MRNLLDSQICELGGSEELGGRKSEERKSEESKDPFHASMKIKLE